MITIRICSKCKIEKSVEEFSLKREKLQSYCKECNNKNGQRWYRANKSSVKVRTRRNKASSVQFIIDYLKDHPCVDCGEADIIVLEFDHLRDKSANISRMAQDGYSVESLLEEIAKCEVVCANDHKRRTALRANWRRAK